MRTCPNGHAVVDDSALFCPVCGSRMRPAVRTCPQGHKVTDTTALFCPVCGSAMQVPERMCSRGHRVADGSAVFCPVCGEPLRKRPGGASVRDLVPEPRDAGGLASASQRVSDAPPNAVTVISQRRASSRDRFRMALSIAVPVTAVIVALALWRIALWGPSTPATPTPRGFVGVTNPDGTPTLADATLSPTSTPVPPTRTPPPHTPAPNTDWTPVAEEVNDVEMVYVPAGCFEMGSTEGDRDEEPVHRVCLSGFWIDRYEITNAQFERLGGEAAEESEWGEPEQPRERITWEEARAYCEIRGARLPTEAEWEYAARGPSAFEYPWGNSFVDWKVVYAGNSYNHPRDVGSRAPGASWVGAYDLSGNVWEWVNDWYDAGYYSASPLRDPQGPDSGTRLVVRGGAWDSGTTLTRAALRNTRFPGVRYDNVGFRCALSD